MGGRSLSVRCFFSACAAGLSPINPDNAKTHKNLRYAFMMTPRKSNGIVLIRSIAVSKRSHATIFYRQKKPRPESAVCNNRPTCADYDCFMKPIGSQDVVAVKQALSSLPGSNRASLPIWASYAVCIGYRNYWPGHAHSRDLSLA